MSRLTRGSSQLDYLVVLVVEAAVAALNNLKIQLWLKYNKHKHYMKPIIYDSIPWGLVEKVDKHEAW